MSVVANPVDVIIGAFGGPTIFLKRLGQRWPNILTRWVRLQRIPHFRRHQIEDLARKFGVTLSAGVLDKALMRRPSKTRAIFRRKFGRHQRHDREMR